MTTLVAFDCGAAFPLDSRTVNTIITEHLEKCAACERLDQLLDHRGEEYSEVSVCGDLNAQWLNTEPEPNYPVEVSGDALALYKEKHP